MSRVEPLIVDALQDLIIKDTLYPNGTPDWQIDTGMATPLNITGQTYEFVVHESIGDGLYLRRYDTLTGGCTIPVGTDGMLITTIPLADLQALGPGDFVYYVRRIDAGTNAVMTKGDFSIVSV